MLIREGLHLPDKMPLTGMPRACLLQPIELPEDCSAEEAKTAWLLRRKNSMGASDIPVIFDESPWNSRYSLWADKLGILPMDPTELEHQRFGHLMEGVMHIEMEKRYPNLHIVDPKGLTVRHPVLNFLTASVDRMVFLRSYRKRKHLLGPGWIPMECKNVSEFKKGEWGPTYVPRLYYIQVQAQMAVTGRNVAVLVAIIGGNRMKVYTVYRDETLIQQIFKEARAFWTLVETNTPPAVDGHDATTEALLHKFPNAARDEKKVIEDKILTVARRHIRLKGLIDRLDHMKQEAGNIIREWMGEDKTAVGADGTTILFGEKTTYTVDLEQLIAKHPEYPELKQKLEKLEEQFKQPNKSRALTVKAKSASSGSKKKGKAAITPAEPEYEQLKLAA